jgi:hypothetical protein
MFDLFLKKGVVILFSFCFVSGALALDARECARLRAEAVRFKPEAARRAVAHLAKNPGYDVVRHRSAVEALAARRDWVLSHLKDPADPHAAEAARLVKGYRAALLANPLLDGDRILCVPVSCATPPGRKPTSRADRILRTGSNGACRAGWDCWA